MQIAARRSRSAVAYMAAWDAPKPLTKAQLITNLIGSMENVEDER